MLFQLLMRITAAITVILLFILLLQYFHVQICFIIPVYIRNNKPAFTFSKLPRKCQINTLEMYMYFINKIITLILKHSYILNFKNLLLCPWKYN